MPFVLLFIGLILVISAAQGTVQALGAQLAKDFTGPGNFVNWIAAIGLVGAVGYVPQLQKFSRVFLGLILVAIFFSGSKQGFWAKLQSALNAIGSGGSAASNTGAPAQAATTLPEQTKGSFADLYQQYTGKPFVSLPDMIGGGQLPQQAPSPLGPGSTTGPQTVPYGGL